MNAVLQTWMEKVNAADLEGVLELYDDSATLLPTFSPRQATTKAAIRAYFENLAAKKEITVELHADSICEYQIGNSVACVCGNYTFSYETEGKIQSFASRFTFVIDADNDHPIIHHHSSQIPQPHHE